MSNQILIHNSGNTEVSTGTQYMGVCGLSSPSATEIARQHVFSASGILSNFKVTLLTAPGIGTSRTFTIRKNGATPSNSLVITISGNDTTGNDLINNVSVSPGDLLGVMTEPTGGAASSLVKMSCVWTPTTMDNTVLPSTVGAWPATLTPVYTAPSGNSSPSTVQDYKKIVIPCSGIIKNLYVVLGTAPGVGQSKGFTIEKNEISQTLACTVSGTATTGNDTTNTVSVVAGDKISLACTENSASPAEDSNFRFGIVFVPNTSGDFILPCSGTTTALSTSANRYEGLFCGSGPSATENNVSQISQTLTLKSLYVEVENAPGDGKSWIISLNIDGVSQTLSTTITGAVNVSNNDIENIAIADGNILSILIDPDSTPNASRLIGVSCCAIVASEPIAFSLKQYSRGDVATLKTTEQDEPIAFTQIDYDHINTGADTFFVTQTGSNNQYSVFNFKNTKSSITSGSSFTVKCVVKSDRATTGASSYSPIYLELYNIEDGTWDNLYTNISTGANGQFTINTTKSTNPGKYFSTGAGGTGSGLWITSRLYQRAV